MPPTTEPRTGLTAEEEAELRERIAALTEGEGITPGPWHAVEDGNRRAYGWWLDNEAGDSSFPSAEDVALFVNTVPRLLATLDASRAEMEGLAERVRGLRLTGRAEAAVLALFSDKETT